MVELFGGTGAVPSFVGDAGQVLDLVLCTGHLGHLIGGGATLGVTPLAAATAQPLSGSDDFPRLQCGSFTEVNYVNGRTSRL